MYDKSYQSKLNINTSQFSPSDALRLLNENNLDEALEICEKCLEKDNTDFQFLNIKGLVLAKLGEYDNAIECFNQALNFNESDEIRMNKINTLYGWAKKLHFPDYNNRKALTVIDEAIKLLGDDDASEFWFLKAEILEGLGDNIEARKCYLKSENKIDELERLQNHLDLFKNYSDETLINITGYTFYNGLKPFKKGVILKLIKEHDNEHDSDAIAVFNGNELVGYVANSDYYLVDDVKSASDIKNLFKHSADAEVVFIYLNELVIARLLL